jgi:hypothetical protein
MGMVGLAEAVGVKCGCSCREETVQGPPSTLVSALLMAGDDEGIML